MSQKAIFIDLDGTLVQHNSEIPATAIQAIQQARSNGHRVFICTGRPRSSIFPEILAIGFDGIICSNGGHIEVGNQIIFKEAFPKAALQKFDNYFTAHDIAYGVETNNGTIVTPKYHNRLATLYEEQLAQGNTEFAKPNAEQWLNSFEQQENLLCGDVNNLVFLANDKETTTALVDTFGDEFEIYCHVVPMLGEFSGDIGMKNVTKGTGVIHVAENLGIPLVDTIGIGDGSNDLPLITTSGIGVAMGNASETLKNQADLITKNIDDDGLYHSFITLGLIE